MTLALQTLLTTTKNAIPIPNRKHRITQKQHSKQNVEHHAKKNEPKNPSNNQ